MEAELNFTFVEDMSQTNIWHVGFKARTRHGHLCQKSQFKTCDASEFMELSNAFMQQERLDTLLAPFPILCVIGAIASRLSITVSILLSI